MTDIYPAGAGILLSTRRLYAAYGTGHAFDLRRASDNATMTADFLSNGELDVATVRSWRGNSTALVTKWYDQSGNGNHFVEATTTKQPELVLDQLNGKPAVYGNGTTSRMTCPNSATFGGGGDQTIVVCGDFNKIDAVNGTNIIGSFDLVGFTGWGTEINSTHKFAYYSKTKGGFSDATTSTDDGIQRSHIVTRTSGALAFYLQGVADGTATGHGNTASTAPAFLFSWSSGASLARGSIGDVAFYASALTAPQIAAIAADHAYFGVKNPVAPVAAAYKGASGVRFIASSYITAGQHLQFERTQAWTIFTAVRQNSRVDAEPTFGGVTSLIAGNAVDLGSSAFRGYELWVDHLGFLRTRLMSNFGTNNYLGVISSINIADDAWHLVALTYDGSSTAAGCKFYIDGVLDANPRVEKDTLSATIVSTADWYIGNQVGVLWLPYYYMKGAIDEFQLHNAERNAAYILAHSNRATIPAASDCVLNYKLDAGSGTSATDSSASGFTGTLTGSPVWLSAAVNSAPVITSNGAGATASVNSAENQTAVTTVTATDADNDTVTFSISAGNDSALFGCDSTTGVLTWLSAPNFESKIDANADGVYEVTVSASDTITTDTQAISVTVTNVNEAPVITSNGGGASASISVAENTTAVTTVTATDVDAGATLTYSISGTDSAKFTIGSSSGVLAFITAPDFEVPTDANTDNAYVVIVQVSDGTLTDTQTITVTVTDVVETSAGLVQDTGLIIGTGLVLNTGLVIGTGLVLD